MRIIFYDSYCGLCHFAVSLLIRLDVSHHLKFAPIGGETYSQLIPKKYQHIDSVFFYDEGTISIKSDAIIKATVFSRSNLKFLKILLFVPKIFRDWIYDFIANNRNRKSTCYLYSDQYGQFLP